MDSLPSSFLGNLTEICFVTPDHRKTIDGLSNLGIGPFRVYRFDNTTVDNFEYRDKPADTVLTVAFAEHNGLTIEIMQPDSGPSLMADFLRENGGNPGIQHIAFAMGGMKMTMQERVQVMSERGVAVAMRGVWKGKKGNCQFCFFDTIGSTGTVFETICFSGDWVDPEGTWYPHKPDSADKRGVDSS